MTGVLKSLLTFTLFKLVLFTPGFADADYLSESPLTMGTGAAAVATGGASLGTASTGVGSWEFILAQYLVGFILVGTGGGTLSAPYAIEFWDSLPEFKFEDIPPVLLESTQTFLESEIELIGDSPKLVDSLKIAPIIKAFESGKHTGNKTKRFSDLALKLFEDVDVIEDIIDSTKYTAKFLGKSNTAQNRRIFRNLALVLHRPEE